MKSLNEICDYINAIIDDAFRLENYNSNFLENLKYYKPNKKTVKEFICSSLGTAIKYQIEELDVYLNGGTYYNFVKESYEWMGKPRALKFKNFLDNILEDANSYAGTKKRGRKPSVKKSTIKSTNK